MGRNDIKLDQINARLGVGQKHIEDNDEAPDETGDGIFIAGIVAIFALVLGVTILFAGGSDFSKRLGVASLFGSNSANYPSIAASCAQGWVPRAQNDTQILCFLTKKINRLCNSQEQSHLVAMYNRYLSDRGRYEVDKAAFEMRQVVVLQSTQGELQDAVRANFKDIQARIDGSVSTRVGVPDRLSGYFKKLREDAGMSDQERAAANVKRVSSREIVMAIRFVGEAGYMRKSDFAWFPDIFVEKAFTDLAKAANPCNS
jgi:hypothetical protein